MSKVPDPQALSREATPRVAERRAPQGTVESSDRHQLLPDRLLRAKHCAADATQLNPLPAPRRPAASCGGVDSNPGPRGAEPVHLAAQEADSVEPAPRCDWGGQKGLGNAQHRARVVTRGGVTLWPLTSRPAETSTRHDSLGGEDGGPRGTPHALPILRGALSSRRQQAARSAQVRPGGRTPPPRRSPTPAVPAAPSASSPPGALCAGTSRQPKRPHSRATQLAEALGRGSGQARTAWTPQGPAP